LSDIELNLLALALQAKLARDAARSDKDHDRTLEAREQDRHAAALLLARVRTQMMDVYRPLTAARTSAETTMNWMARQLDFEWLRLTARTDACFMRPSERLYPHLVVYTIANSPESRAHALEAQGATMWHKWSSGDLQVRRRHQDAVVLAVHTSLSCSARRHPCPHPYTTV
jgi:hypothetical protein